MNNQQPTVTQALTILAPAKLNLALQILGKRSDNYHELLTLFQSIDLSDRLQFDLAPAQKDELRLSVSPSLNADTFPLDENNIIKKAATLFWQNAPKQRGAKEVTVSVSKNIPIGAGLAGGSANAAATLVALNHLEGSPLSFAQLIELAVQLGSDVPFSLTGGRYLGQGRGEKLTKLPVQSHLTFVLVKPRDISISTAWAYDALDLTNGIGVLDTTTLEELTKKLAVGLDNKNIYGSYESFANSFEPIVFAHHPVLKKIKERLTALGCLCAHMTGSGPTIYGLAKDAAHAQRVLTSITNDQTRASSVAWYKDHGLSADTWLARSIDHGIRVINDA